MAQPQIESFTVSADGLTITLKYDQILYGQPTMTNFPSLTTPSDYSLVEYNMVSPLLEKDFYAGFDTFVYISRKATTKDIRLPLLASVSPSLVTSLTTNIQVTDFVNDQGEAPVNVTNLVLDTSNTPTASVVNPPYDILNTFNKKVRKQASRDKILCVYNTAPVSGQYDEPLIDAYFDEYGITNHIKFGVDFSIASNVDWNYWENWGLEVYNLIIDNGIEQVCCGPLCPGNMSIDSYSGVAADTSTILGSIKATGAKMLNEGKEDLSNMRGADTETFFHKNDSGINETTYADYYWYSPDLEAGESSGSTQLGLGYLKGSFKANIGGLDTETFRGLSNDNNTSISVPGLHFNQYEPAEINWGSEATPYQSMTLRMPAWRIGYYPIGGAPICTTTIIRQMVKNSKAASMPTEKNKEEKVLLLNTFYSQWNLKDADDTVYLSHLWESLGYTKSFFGATNKQRVIDNLTNLPGTVVGDTGLTKYEWQGLNPPANGAMDYIGEIQVTPQANDATNVYLNSVWMEQWDGGGAIGAGMAYRAKSTGTTFPIDADIVYDQTRNFNGNYDGSIMNAFKCKPGGIRFNPTSHGHKAGIWELANGASASIGSWYEPYIGAVRHYPMMIADLLRGHTIAAANMFSNKTFTTSGSVWGDGLLQPYYEQAQEDETMKSIYRNMYGKTAPDAGIYTLTSKGILSGTGFFNEHMGNAPFESLQTYLWPIFPTQITSQGSGYFQNGFIISGTGGNGSGFSLTGLGLSGGVYSSYNHANNTGQGVGYTIGDVVTFNGDGGTGMQVTLVPGPLQYTFKVGNSSQDTALLIKTITYNVVAGDTIEDICDGLILLINTALQTNDAGRFYYATKVQAANGPRNTRYGIRISGISSARQYRLSVDQVQASPTTGSPTGIPFETYTPKQNFISGVDDPNGYSVGTDEVSYEGYQRDINDNPIWGNGYINFSQADASLFLLTVPAAGAFTIFINGQTASEIAYFNTQVGEQPKILKITFKNITRPDRSDIVVNGTDLDPWINVYNLAVATHLNANSGTAKRLLPLVEGESYEVITEFTAANLGITPGGGGASKSVISRSVISHNTES